MSELPKNIPEIVSQTFTYPAPHLQGINFLPLFLPSGPGFGSIQENREMQKLWMGLVYSSRYRSAIGSVNLVWDFSAPMHCLFFGFLVRGLSQKSCLLFFFKSKNDARKIPCRGNLSVGTHWFFLQCLAMLWHARVAVSQRWSYQ